MGNFTEWLEKQEGTITIQSIQNKLANGEHINALEKKLAFDMGLLKQTKLGSQLLGHGTVMPGPNYKADKYLGKPFPVKDTTMTQSLTNG